MAFFNIRSSFINLLLLILITVDLGCSQAPTNNEPDISVNAGNDFSQLELTKVEIGATLQGNTKITKSYWQQTNGIKVNTTSKKSSTLVFTTPKVPSNDIDHTLSFNFIAIDENNNQVEDSISIKITKPLPNAYAGEIQEVLALSKVKVHGSPDNGFQDIIQVSWQQTSGPKIKMSNALSAEMFFTAPNVHSNEVVTLNFTIKDKFGRTDTDDVKILVKPIAEPTPSHPLLLTPQRIEKIKQKITQNDTFWRALTSKISHYYEKTPYNTGEYAGAFALAYYISKNPKYMDRSISLLMNKYFREPIIGWQHYKSRNLFRTNASWAIMGYSWIKNFISKEEQIRIESILTVWAEFWLKHVDYSNDFKSFYIKDTDDVTSITKNLTLLGYVLSNSTTHSALGQKLLAAGDLLLERYVVGYYMQDIMKGGAWAEGSDYSPNTQRHWIETFLINKDERGIEYPSNYAKFALKSLVHQTLAGDTGVYKYGSEEDAIDYDKLSGDYRYEFALSLMSILEEEEDINLINQWFKKIIDKEGFKSGSSVTNFGHLLYYNPSLNKTSAIETLDTFHYAEGVGLIASRDSWQKSATNLYFINRMLRVDQEHRDALSFDIAHSGTWITKETTGYGGTSDLGIAHNTILIENAGDGSSSPIRRPAGKPKYHGMYDDEYVTLISADATDAYNMKGYFATNYAKQVNRQLAFLKPNLVIVYDHTITDKSQITDLSHYTDLDISEGMEHTRWVKLIQHVQAKPSKISNRHNTYQVEAENRILGYQVILPRDATVSVVDEQKLWEGVKTYDIPENQKKWHFNISMAAPKQENEFITSLSFGINGEATIDQLLIDPIIMTKENAYITNGNIIGMAIEAQQRKYIILFSRNPEEIEDNIQINVPDGFENALVYGVGFEVN